MKIGFVNNGNNTYTIDKKDLLYIISKISDINFKNSLLDFLFEKTIIGLSHYDYCLYRSCGDLIEWTQEDVNKVKLLFSDNYHIERHLAFDNLYLTISDDGKNNRQWKKEEFDKVRQHLLYGDILTEDLKDYILELQSKIESYKKSEKDIPKSILDEENDIKQEIKKRLGKDKNENLYNIEDKKPEHYKDIVGYDKDNIIHYCFLSEYDEWRCSLTGFGLSVKIIKWKYAEKK